MEKEVYYYQTRLGREPYLDWLHSLDNSIRHRIEIREDRIKQGNYGDHKRFAHIIELRINFGKGYRIYCGEDGDKLVILLAGGDKSSQDKDIKNALENWRDYYDQKKV